MHIAAVIRIPVSLNLYEYWIYHFFLNNIVCYEKKTLLYSFDSQGNCTPSGSIFFPCAQYSFPICLPGRSFGNVYVFQRIFIILYILSLNFRDHNIFRSQRFQVCLPCWTCCIVKGNMTIECCMIIGNTWIFASKRK